MEEEVKFPLPVTVSSPPDDPTIVEVINTTDTDKLWDQFNKFYNENQKAIEKCMKTDVRSLALAEKVSDIELQIDSLSETAKTVLDGLAELGKIHPVIGAAVIAFHALVSLDLSRRDNDRKVNAIMLEMQNMMCAMFQLRHLKHNHVRESERDAEKSRLHKLIENITADIKKCGSDLDYYLGQKLAFKLIKAKKFEQRFKTHVENFALRRSELQSTIAVYTAGVVEQANLTITAVSKQIDIMDTKLDHFFHLVLRKLDTPQEKQAFQFVYQNNGVENCISKDDLLAQLLMITGDVLPDNETKGELQMKQVIAKSRRVLFDELRNFEESLMQNVLRFERLLTVQNNNHERIIAQLDKQEGYHKVTLSQLDKLLSYLHPDMGLHDPKIRRVWELMGLRTNVDAKVFILTFRDHYQDDHSDPPTQNPSFANENNEAWSLPLSTTFDQPNPAMPYDLNARLLEYIDVAHVGSIVEAVDTDGSGFISIKEINTFVRARPKEWSVLQWMVYWAAGWHTSVTQYRDKICETLVLMHELLPSLHPANRVYVDDYLNGYCMDTIEGILRSTKSVTDDQLGQIVEMAQFYAEAQETALRKNLQEVSYVISSATDATLVAGPTRAESWIYPLLYLLLQRHLEVIKLGRIRILNRSEMYTHQVSLDSVLAVFQHRKETLITTFSQIYHNVADHFMTFAHGMFYASFMGQTGTSLAENTLTKIWAKRSPREILFEMCDKSEEAAVQADTTVFPFENGVPLEDFNIYDSASTATVPAHVPHPLTGYWSVKCFDSDGDLFLGLGLFHFALSVASDGSMIGTGESYVGRLKLTGTSAFSGEGFSQSVKLKMVVDNSEVDYIFYGIHNPERDTVTGSWDKVERPQETSPEASSKGTTDEMHATARVNTGKPLEAPSDVDFQDTGAPDASTHEVAFSGAPNAEVDSRTPTQVDDVVEEAQTPNPPKDIAAGEHLSDLHASGAPDDTYFALENDLPQETKNLSEGSDNTTSEKDDDSHGSEPSQDLQTSEDAAENADDSGEQDEERLNPLNTFSMRRTPAHMHRFRRDYNLDSKTDSSVMAKNRWSFAIKATLFQVQGRDMTWDYVRTRFAERKLWLDLTVLFWQNLLPIDRIGLMCTLTGEYGPSQSRIYETIAHYLNQRGYASKTGIGISCDYCGRTIACDRYRCITCMKEDLTNQIDLCVGSSKCIENACSNSHNDFVHTPSHTLLRQKFFLHKFYLSSFISQCRARSENTKERFRTLEENGWVANNIAKAWKSRKSGHTSQMEEASNFEPLFCVCCVREVSLPCWTCATCAMETIVCIDCELMRAKIVLYVDQDSVHSHDHLLLRISDSAVVQPPREVTNVGLQIQLINITADLRNLEQKVATHLRAASKMNTVLKKFKVDRGDKVATEKSANGVHAANGETAAPSSQKGVNDDDDDDDDLSDILGSVYSSDTENEALVSAADTQLPAEPQPLPAESEATGTEGVAASSWMETSPKSSPEVKVKEVTSLVEGALMDTPTPTNVQFFEMFTNNPNTSVPQNDTDSSTPNTENGSSPKVEADREAAPVEPPTQTSKSRRLTNHLVSIDTQISSLDTQMTLQMSSLDSHISSIDTRISCVDTRISSLDNRLLGVETQLGEILSLLRQSR